MVVKKTNSKTSTRKVSNAKKLFSLIAVAKVPYGPFETKQSAESVLRRVSMVPRCKVSPITRTSRGYTFSASVFYGLKSASQKKSALAAIKKHAPSARVTFQKA